MLNGSDLLMKMLQFRVEMGGKGLVSFHGVLNCVRVYGKVRFLLSCCVAIRIGSVRYGTNRTGWFRRVPS